MNYSSLRSLLGDKRSVRYRYVILFASTLVVAGMASVTNELRIVTAPHGNEALLSTEAWHEGLAANVWTPIETHLGNLLSYRTDHGGAVYVPTENSVVMFGSDTHLRNFDNRILELRLDDLSWHYPYVQSPRFALRTDSLGRRIAGVEMLLPWPMHVYDAMIYDPVNREVIVSSGAKHSFIVAPGVQSDPLWAYSPELKRWRIVDVEPREAPNFFAAGVVYDSLRDTIIGYGSMAQPSPFVPLAAEDEIVRTGVWELGPDRRKWHLAFEQAHHWGWFNAEFDAANRAMIVFGGSREDSDIWVYRTGEAGSWEKRTPAGDSCPGGYYFPASYDDKRGVTLFMPHDRAAGISVTCLYDAANNVSRRLPKADLPWLGLNYTLVYASEIDIYVLVAGSFSRNEPTSVWALRLDLNELAAQRR